MRGLLQFVLDVFLDARLHDTGDRRLLPLGTEVYQDFNNFSKYDIDFHNAKFNHQ